MKIREMGAISLDSYEIFVYGGCSYLIVDKEHKYCYKIMKERLSVDKKKIILQNLIRLPEKEKQLILPEVLYLDEKGFLSIEKMKFIEGTCGIRNIRSLCNKDKYLLLIDRIIKAILLLKQKGYIVTDLKGGNIVFDRNFVPYFIDNDFTFYQRIPLELQSFFLNNPYIFMYTKVFQSPLDVQYNLFALYFMLAQLLLTNEEFEFVCNLSRKSRWKSMSAINYFIQKNKGIPMQFKLELRNLFEGNHDIVMNDTIREDLHDYLTKRLRRGILF